MKNQVICKNCGEVSKKLTEKNINSKISFIKFLAFFVKLNVIISLSAIIQGGIYAYVTQELDFKEAIIIYSVFGLFISIFTLYLIISLFYHIFPRCKHCSSRNLVTLSSPEGVKTMQLNKKVKDFQDKQKAKKEAESEDKEEDKKEG